MSDAFENLGKTANDYPDCRQSQRVVLKAQGSLVLTRDYEHQLRFPCLIINSSQGGFRLRVNFRLRCGQVVEVVSAEDPLTSVECRVIWVGKAGSQEQGEAGLQII